MSATKHGYLDLLIALLVIAALALLFTPCLTAGQDTASVMGYIGFPEDHKEITAGLEEAIADFTMNGAVGMPILMLLLGIVALIILLMKRGDTISLIPAMLFSLVAIFTSWTNPLMQTGNLDVITTVLMIAEIFLCAINGSWKFRNESEAWKTDPGASEKLRAIGRAAQKKDISLLSGYAKGTDPKVCAAALEAIGQIGSSEGFQPLVAGLSRSHPDVRIAAAHALGELGDLRGRTFLKHYMESDTDSRVRAAMKQALSKLPTHEA